MFNGLTPAEAERLFMLSEEAGEIVQAVGKILRHGPNSRHPEGGETNIETLRRELSDLIAVATIMREKGDPLGDFKAVDGEHIWQRKLRYTHHQSDAA